MIKINNCIFLIVLSLLSPFLTSCSSDDDQDNKTTDIKKSELIGTWYSLDEGCLLEITSDVFTKYELKKVSLFWLYAPLSGINNTWYYKIKGSKLLSINGSEFATVNIQGNTMTIVIQGKALHVSKYSGTPKDLINYLNRDVGI